MEENVCKLCDWQGIHLQNIQTAPTVQYRHLSWLPSTPESSPCAHPYCELWRGESAKERKPWPCVGSVLPGQHLSMQQNCSLRRCELFHGAPIHTSAFSPFKDCILQICESITVGCRPWNLSVFMLECNRAHLSRANLSFSLCLLQFFFFFFLSGNSLEPICQGLNFYLMVLL